MFFSGWIFHEKYTNPRQLNFIALAVITKSLHTRTSVSKFDDRDIIYVEHIYGAQAAAATAVINIQFVLLTERRFCGRVRDHNWKGPLMHPQSAPRWAADSPYATSINIIDNQDTEMRGTGRIVTR